MITIEHTLAYTELKICVTELKLMTHFHFIEILMILTKYVFDVSVWLTEYSVTVGSVTLRFYCIVKTELLEGCGASTFARSLSHQSRA